MSLFELENLEEKISPDIVGNKFNNLYLIKQLPAVHIPPAFCITDPHDVTHEFHQRFKPGKKYAIRSSASVEDTSRYSAAGIFKSYLNLESIEEIIDAITVCFQSYHLPEAQKYFELQGIDGSEIQMSVIIQEMVEAEKSGIVFTQNPLNGNDEYLIEYSTGVGNQIFSRFSKSKFSVLSKTNLAEDPLSREIQKTAKAIEDYYQSPQDIEWAWSNSTLYILQTRPLVCDRTRKYQPHEVWTRANIGEIMPRPLTPLSWGIFQQVISGAYRFKYYSIFDWIITNMIHRLPRTQPQVKRPQTFFGVMYLNLDTIYRSFGSEPWVTAQVLESGMGFSISENIDKSHITFFDKLAIFLKKILYGIELILPVFSMERRVFSFLNSQKLLTIENKKNSLDELIRRNQFLLGWHIAITARSFSHLGLLINLSKVFKEYRLNLNRIISLLSREKSDPYFREFKNLLSKKDSDRTIQAEHDSSNEDMMLQNFMKKFGHRSENEFELSQPSWAENPDILQRLQGVTVTTHPDKTEEISLSFLGKKILKRMSLSIEKRENLKSLLIKNYREIRFYFLEKATDAVNKSYFEKENDIFFLEPGEIGRIGEFSNSNISLLLRRRREEFKNNSRQRIPFMLYGDISPVQFLPHDFNGRIIRGIGCSEGVVTGKALILEDYDDSIKINPEDILVTTSADPGWIPLLLSCRGMITEMGGILSHICTIARENDIPIVVGVNRATDYIKNGQTISIDGSNGMIILTDE